MNGSPSGHTSETSRATAKWSVHLWADGVYFNVRLEEDRQCILVLLGATEDGQKKLLAIVDGYRESEQSWTDLLLDMKAHELTVDLKLADDDASRVACLAKVFKLTESASKKWRALNGSSLIPDVIQGIPFLDGIKQTEAAA